jgi:methylmalonyl-CoA/ethylmalonyl-CoA epimerase
MKRSMAVGETYIELLESASPDSGVSQWIREKGSGLFHICLEVDDIEGALAATRQTG